jgi:hypothetical protein
MPPPRLPGKGKSFMSQSRIFIIGEQPNQLVPMAESPYDAEHVLQEHLATTPDLIPGDQINQDAPRRWLLVKREAGIPAEKDGGNYWSLDLIFVDQDGIPTLVECKRSGDLRLRREVVAQMLDYAANAMAYWPSGKLRLLAEETAQAAGCQPEQRLRELLQHETPLTEQDQDAFWIAMDDNLQKGNLRLLFVSDVIPKELRRLVEFLNAKMGDVEVLAVELKQFVNAEQTLKAFVPRVIGQTELALTQKSSGKRKASSLESLLATYPQRTAFDNVLQLAKRHGHIVEPGITNFAVKCLIDGKVTTYAFGKPTPIFQLYFEYLHLAGHQELIHKIENLFQDLGYAHTGKYTISIDLTQAGETVMNAIDHVMTLLDEYENTTA